MKIPVWKRKLFHCAIGDLASNGSRSMVIAKRFWHVQNFNETMELEGGAWATGKIVENYAKWVQFHSEVWSFHIKVNSVQEACAKCFAVHILRFEILQTTWKNKTKNIKLLDLLTKNWKLRVWSSLFYFFLWFARFQILICEPQSIWRKSPVLSWL